MSYDDYGNMTSIADSDSLINFSYTKIGKDYYVSSTQSAGTSMPDSELIYSYDELGNRTQMDSSWGSFFYAYDAGNRLTQIKNHKNEIFGFNYDVANRLTGITRPGSSTSLSFDVNSFVTSIVHSKDVNTVIESFSYTRDALGNRTSITNSRGIASFGYDKESQLSSVTNSEITGDYASQSFSYDSLGNRSNDQLGSYAYDNKSQRLTEDYRYQYYYDNNGNLSSKVEKANNANSVNYSYNSENQLIKIETYRNSILTKTSEYFYDALGRRMRKKITDHTDSSKSYERKYIYDGQEILAELDKDNNDLAVYTHSSLRTDDVLAVDVKSTKIASSTGSYFYLKDALGSVVDIVDSSGNLKQHYAYSSFGKIVKITDGSGADVTASPVVKTSYGFTNREHDVESGMMYYRARYYVPEIGRFIQEDPFAGILRYPATIHSKYVYSVNNPIIYRDPNGKIWSLGTMIGLIIGGIIVHDFLVGPYMRANGKKDYHNFVIPDSWTDWIYEKATGISTKAVGIVGTILGKGLSNPTCEDGCGEGIPIDEREGPQPNAPGPEESNPVPVDNGTEPTINNTPA